MKIQGAKRAKNRLGEGMDPDDWTFPISLELDEHGYPSDHVLADRITGMPADKAYEFLRDHLVKLAEELVPYGMTVHPRTEWERPDDVGGKVIRITLTTGGWSGCEDFVAAVLDSPARLYYVAWERGGKHVFEVSL